VQANTTPQFYNLAAPSTFADGTTGPGYVGTIPNARYIAIVGRFVVLSGLVANPYTLQWCGLNAPFTWDGTNSSSQQTLPDGGVVRGVAGGEGGAFIFQDFAIRTMTYTQEAVIVFQIQRISQDRGLYGPYTLTRAGEQIFFLAPQGLHRIVPGGLPEEIGKAKFNRTLMADIDRGNLQLAIGAVDPRQSRIFLAYKSTGNPNLNYDKLLCYDYLLDKTTLSPLTGEYFLSLAQPGITLEGLDAIAPGASIDAMPANPSLDTFTNALTPEMSHFDTAHQLNWFRGLPMQAIMDTGEQGGTGQRMRVRGFRPITDATAAFGSLVVRENVQAAPVVTTETAVNAIGVCPQNASTRYARARVRIPAGTLWNYCIGVEPDVTTEGLR
jgi:hypothetical protein